MIIKRFIFCNKKTEFGRFVEIDIYVRRIPIYFKNTLNVSGQGRLYSMTNILCLNLYKRTIKMITSNFQLTTVKT